MKHICIFSVVVALVGSSRVLGESTFTEHDLRKALLEYNQRTLVEAYKQVGKRDPKWDEDAVSLLGEMAKVFAASGADRWYAMENTGLRALEPLAKKITKAGCDDPMVVYCYGAILDQQNKDREALPLLRKAADELMRSAYPMNRALAATQRLLNLLDAEKDREEFIKVRQMVIDTMVASISVAEPKGLDRRLIIDSIIEHMEKMPIEDQQEVHEKAQQVKADEWMLNIVGGVYEKNAAWVARGSGWASTVTEEGWKAFEEHLQKAKACLERAWQIEPKFPEAATEMIPVSMGMSDGQERAWFDRAIEAQLDHERAYGHYLWALRPRWGGSYGKMLALGDECRATGRYDTRVPYMAITAIGDIVSDQDGSKEAWRNEAIGALATEVLNGYAEAAKNEKDKKFYRSMLVGIDWVRGQYDAARPVLDELKGELDPKAVARFGLVSWRMADQIYALTGGFGKELAEAQEQSAANPGAARKVFDDIAKKMDAKDPGKRFASCRAQELAWLEPFEKGEWVNLMPKPGLWGWEVVHGSWNATKDGTLMAKTSGAGTAILCMAEFGIRYEISGVAEIDNNHGEREANGGPILGYKSAVNHYGMWLRKKSQQVVMRRGGRYTTAWPAQIGDRNEFHVQVWDNYTSASVNGTPAFSEYEMRDYVTEGPTRIGVGSQLAGANSIVKFKNLKIRKLTLQPASITTQPATKPSQMRMKRVAEAVKPG